MSDDLKQRLRRFADLIQSNDEAGVMNRRVEMLNSAAYRIAELERIVHGHALENVDGLRRDTDRLDWLQQNQCSIYRVVDEILRPSTSTFNHYEKASEFVGWSIDCGRTTCPTIRAAIDQAIGSGDAKE